MRDPATGRRRYTEAARHVTNRVKWAVRRVRGRPAGRRTTRERPPPDPVNPVDEFSLVAICFAFAEDDIIEATVLNAFTQGCDRFLLIDHASPDQTISRAVAAGAEHVVDVGADAPFEDTRLKVINELADEVAGASRGRPTWFLHLDADEFPRGPGGRTVREYLAALDSTFRVVGSRFYNHYPMPGVSYLRGGHPIDRQPLCERELVSYCGSGHYKHPLLRHDPGGPTLRQWWGLHRPEDSTSAPWSEPALGIITHHFPFRDEARCRWRMELINERSRRPRREPVTLRSHSVDAVYQGHWSQVRLRHTRLGDRPVQLRHWHDVLGPADHEIARWPPPSTRES